MTFYKTAKLDPVSNNMWWFKFEHGLQNYLILLQINI